MITESRFNEIISKFSSIKPILVVGDVGVDKYSSGIVKRISPEAPVPIIEVNKEWYKLGLAANVSDNLKSLGIESTICSVIGSDQNANTLEGLLEESSLKTWGIVRDKSRMTTFKERIVSESQQICRVDYETKTHLDLQIQNKLIERILEFSNSHSSIILEDYGKGLLTEEVCSEVFKLAKEKNLSVAVDPSRTTPPLWYKGASLLKPNFLEASLMVKSLGYLEEMKVSEMAKILIDKLSLDQVIITLGSKGMGMIDAKANGEYIEIPTVAREVFDVSGAGDTAISAIMASISAGASLEEAAWIGNCASGVVVGKRGTALVTSEELSDFYINLKNNL